MIHAEKRNGKRFKLERPIVYIYRNTDKFFNADMLNYSVKGICFRSDYPIKSGTQIYVMTEDKPINDSTNNTLEAFFAETVWCKNSNGYFTIGARNAYKSYKPTQKYT